jgi:hypothetical protein
MEVPDTGKIMSIGYIAALLLILFFVYKILKGVGIIKSAEKKKEKAETEKAITDLRGVPQFAVTYLDNKRDYRSLDALAQTYAEELRKALRGLGTDEEAVYSIFSRLQRKENITEIATVYKNRYNRDLLADLLNDLTDKEKAKLMNIINSI